MQGDEHLREPVLAHSRLIHSSTKLPDNLATARWGDHSFLMENPILAPGRHLTRAARKRQTSPTHYYLSWPNSRAHVANARLGKKQGEIFLGAGLCPAAEKENLWWLLRSGFMLLPQGLVWSLLLSHSCLHKTCRNFLSLEPRALSQIWLAATGAHMLARRDCTHTLSS